MKWYGSLVLICLLGLALIVYSRYERQHPSAATPPAIGAHWYQALGFDVCGAFEPNLAANPNASTAPIPGIHTDGDGVIQVAPTKAAKDAGNNATLARFVATYPKFDPDLEHPADPGQGEVHQRREVPDRHPRRRQVRPRCRSRCGRASRRRGRTSHRCPTTRAAIKLADGQLITVAFVPSGSSVPKPNSIATMLTDRAGSATTTTAPAAIPTTTTASTPTTTAASAPTTTAPSKATTTSTLPSPTRTTVTTKPSNTATSTTPK